MQTCISRRCWIHNAGYAGYFTKQILLDQAIELRNHRKAMNLTGIETHFQQMRKMHPISAIFLNLLCSIYIQQQQRSYHQLKCSFILLLPAVFHASFHTAQRRKIKAMASEHINLSLFTSLCLIFFALLVCKAVACFFPDGFANRDRTLCDVTGKLLFTK